MFRSLENDGARLVEECSAFLAGRFSDELVRRSRPRPSWSWLNQLAHGTVVDLERCAGLLATQPPKDQWALATAFLAGELLAAAERGPSLQTLRNEVLVPLELDLVSFAHRPIWEPSDFVLEALARIEEWVDSSVLTRRRARR